MTTTGNKNPFDWNKLFDVMMVSMATYLILSLVVLALTGCSSTRTHEDNRRTSMQADTLVEMLRSENHTTQSSASADSLSVYRHLVDSLVRVTRERETMHTGHGERQWVMVHDSMWMTLDSMGLPSFHYKTFVDRTTEKCDTIYRDRLVETDTRRVSQLRDSLTYYHGFVESLMEYNLHNDSVYHARMDSLEHLVDVERQKKPSVIERVKEEGKSTFLLLVIVVLLASFSAWVFKKKA